LIYDGIVTKDEEVFSMESFDRELYLEQLRMYYSGDRDSLEQFIMDMTDSLDCYLEEHPTASTKDIYQHFAHPEELRAECETVRQQRRWHRRRNRQYQLSHFCLVFFVLIIAFCLTGILYYGYQQYADAMGKANYSFYHSTPNQTVVPAETPQITPITHTDYQEVY
jgi:hypothetical protein